MRILVDWMRERPDKSVHRHPGGFWRNQEPQDPCPPIAGTYIGSFGTRTVQAIVDRGVAEWVAWQDGRSGRFPIQARLKS
jgi:hypothetical protein